MYSPHRRASIAAAALLASACVLGWLAAGGPHAASSPAPDMYLYPDGLKVQGAAGGYFPIYVAMDGAVDLGAFSFEIHYDDSVVTAVGVEEKGYFSSGGPVACSGSIAVAGTVTYGCTLIGGSGVNGSGIILATIGFTFNDAFDGSLPFLMQDCEAADSDGDAIALTACKGMAVTVVPVPPAAPMNMQPTSMKVQAPPGSTFTFDVTVGDVTDLGGIEFAVEFDDAVLNVSDIREGPFLGSAGGDTVCFFDNYNAPDRARLGCVVFGKYGPTGSGVIAHVDVTMKAPFVGTTPLVLADCKLSDEQGHRIPVSECTGASLQTNATPTGTPTHTPTITPITPQDVGGVSRDPALGGDALGTRGTAGGSTPMNAILVTIVALAASAGVAAFAVHRRGAR